MSDPKIIWVTLVHNSPFPNLTITFDVSVPKFDPINVIIPPSVRVGSICATIGIGGAE